ncbi:hypothetical protein ACWGJX_37945 [Streptomyces sp. NPDC054775]
MWAVTDEERDLVDVVLDVVDGEPDEPTDGLGIKEDQGSRDPFHERKIVAGHDLANQGDAFVLADRGPGSPCGSWGPSTGA